jgi:hypothetical protein
MSLNFFDTNNVQLPRVYRSSGSAGVPGAPFTIRFDARDGYSLWAIAEDGVAIEGRKAGDTSWTDLMTSPIDVSAFDGTAVDYQIRLTPETDEEYEISLLVSETPGGSVVNGNGELVLNGNRRYVLR